MVELREGTGGRCGAFFGIDELSGGSWLIL
jgi:hypothetical protein